MNKREFAERLKLTYRPIYDSATKYEEVSPNEMLIKTENGCVYLYDIYGDTIRTMPKNSNMDIETFAIEFGERLRRIMDRKGITQEILSEETGISQTILSRYILAKSIPGLYAVDKISIVLGCRIDDLFYRY